MDKGIKTDSKLMMPALLSGILVFVFVLVNLLTSSGLPLIAVSLITLAVSAAGGVITYLYIRRKPSAESSKLPPKVSFPFCIPAGVITVGLLSQSSPLYPLNCWEDPNIYFTIGRSMLHGKVLYRDIFDHKGPLIYMIHSLAALLTERSFFGMFILQSLGCAVTIYYALRIMSLFTKIDVYSYLVSIPLVMLDYSSVSYFYGDSAEELLLPFFTMALYIAVRSAKERRLPGVRESMLLGAGGAVAFWVKYTLCGFFIGIILFIIIMSVRLKDPRGLLRSAASFASSCILLSVPVLLYFLVNGSLSDLYEVYFFNNIFLYGASEGAGIPLIGQIPYVMSIALIRLGQNPFIALMIFVSILYITKHRQRTVMLLYLLLLVCDSVFIFSGKFQAFYYVFALSALTIPGWGAVRDLISRTGKAISSVVCIALCVTAFFVSYATFNIFSSASDLPQYVFADIMSEDPGATMLNYGFLDQGFYTAAGIVPSEKFFCGTNIDDTYDESRVSKEEAISEGRVSYVVTRNHMLPEGCGYEIIATADHTQTDFNGIRGTDTYILYRIIPESRR